MKMQKFGDLLTRQTTDTAPAALWTDWGPRGDTAVVIDKDGPKYLALGSDPLEVPILDFDRTVPEKLIADAFVAAARLHQQNLTRMDDAIACLAGFAGHYSCTFAHPKTLAKVADYVVRTGRLIHGETLHESEHVPENMFLVVVRPESAGIYFDRYTATTRDPYGPASSWIDYLRPGAEHRAGVVVFPDALQLFDFTAAFRRTRYQRLLEGGL